MKKNHIFHFVRRDCLDSLIGWTLVTGLALLFHLGLMPKFPKYALTLYGVSGALYFAFSLFQTVSFWGGVQNQLSSPSRAYLLSLPIKRRNIFWLCMIRGWIVGLPMAFALYYFPFFITAEGNWKEVLEPIFTLPRYLIYVVFATLSLFFTPLFACRLATFNQGLRRTVAKWDRFTRYLQFLLIDNLLNILSIFSGVAAIPLLMNSQETLKWTGTLLVGGLFNVWQLRRAYREWLHE